MQIHYCRLIGLVGLGLMMTCCAGSVPDSVLPPQLQTPPQAAEPCELYRLPEEPTLADLEVGYATRGAEILACDGLRRLAVETAAAEHELEAAWAAQRTGRRRSWFHFW